MKHGSKRLLACFLAVVTAVSSVQLNSFAAIAQEENGSIALTREEPTELTESKESGEAPFRLVTDERYNDAGNHAKGTENDGKVRWIIDRNGKLWVEGEGDFFTHDGDDLNQYAPDPDDRHVAEKRPPWAQKAMEIKAARLQLKGITVLSGCFSGCMNLTDVDFGGSDLGLVTNIAQMYSGCNALEAGDLSMFSASPIERMHGLFAGCGSMRSVKLDGLDTSRVDDLSGMFDSCQALETLNLSGFKTANVCYMDNTFRGCSSLTQLDLGKFDLSKIKSGDTQTDKLLEGCASLERIVAPKHLAVSTYVLPVAEGKTWYRSDTGGEETILPPELTETVILTREKPGESGEPEEPEKPEEPEEPEDPGDGTGLQITGITLEDRIYNGTGESFGGTPLIRMNGKEVKNPKITYVYSGTMADASVYPASEYAPVNAGDYKLTITVRDQDGQELGSREYAYRIERAELTLSVPEMSFYRSEIRALPASPAYLVTGLCGRDVLLSEPVFAYEDADGNPVERGNVSLLAPGTYQVIADKANAGMNYRITYLRGTLHLLEGKVFYSVTFHMNGHGTAVAPLTGIAAGSTISAPRVAGIRGYLFKGWYREAACVHEWQFEKDIVQSNLTLYACWVANTKEDGSGMYVQDVRAVTYTGKALKPQVRIYTEDGSALLTEGKHYKIRFYNNVHADTKEEAKLGGICRTGEEGENGFTRELAYFVITGKGNYTGTIYGNFHILPAGIANDEGALAPGFAQKYKDHLTVRAKKAQKPFTSLKYNKKKLKEGEDYAVTLAAADAYDGQGNALREGFLIDKDSALPSVPAGYKGRFQLTVTGMGDYTGRVVRDLWVEDEVRALDKAAVTLGKDLRTVKNCTEDDLRRGVVLPPGFYDAGAKKYYAVSGSGEIDDHAEADGRRLFTVRYQKDYLVYGRDYIVSYTDNHAAGTAVLTVSGIGVYSGEKSVKFKIADRPFNAGNMVVEGMEAQLSYNGKALTQNDVAVYPKGKSAKDALKLGTHYNILYKNNINRGTATMTFVAIPESGYRGEFSKTFAITGCGLSELVKITGKAPNRVSPVSQDAYKLESAVEYDPAGAEISACIRIMDKTGKAELMEGRDYTVAYRNNRQVTAGANLPKESKPCMILTGKGNYSGTVTVYFEICRALIGVQDIAMEPMAVIPAKGDGYLYRPALTVTAGSARLKEGAKKDYEVTYRNNSQADIVKWLTDEEGGVRPTAVLTVPEESGYRFRGEKGASATTMEIPLWISLKPLKGNQIYAVADEFTYTGSPIRPCGEAFRLYVGAAADVKAAQKAEEKEDVILTDREGRYRLRRLEEGEDYVLHYGENVRSGSNAGSVTATVRSKEYSGKFTFQFSISRKEFLE